jgi:2-iminobutanoate/2-iminopropanoate deaminase
MARTGQTYHRRAAEQAFAYSHAVKAGNQLFISGVVSWNKDAEPLAVGDMSTQVKHIYDELRETLAAHGAGFEHVVKETVFTVDIDALMAALPVRAACFAGCEPPASTLVQVQRLVMPQFLIEVEMIAILD